MSDKVCSFPARPPAARLQKALMNDIEMQQYLFDLQGYLVVENVLIPAEVAALNALLDQQNLPETAKGNRFGAAPEGSGFLGWGQPFCDLLDHAATMPVLRFRLGDCFRLDRLYGIHMSKGEGRGQLHSDYGTSSFTSGAQPGVHYRPPENELANGFVVVAWSLADTGPDHGGFCCIPGSHKSNFKMPQKIQDDLEAAPCVVIPPAPAGSVILFTESLTHSTASWQGPHDRRSLLYKYCVSQIAWTNKRVQPPAGIDLTARQQILFREPADPHRFFPSLFDEVEK